MPGVFRQFFTFLCREFLLQFRIRKSLLIDQALVLLAGGVLGALHSEMSPAAGRDMPAFSRKTGP